MADEYKIYDDPSKDPRLNDDSQPSVTSPEQVLEQSNARAGIKATQGGQLPPADAVDMEVRKMRADVDTEEVAKAVREVEKSGEVPAGTGVDDVAKEVATGGKAKTDLDKKK